MSRVLLIVSEPRVEDFLDLVDLILTCRTLLMGLAAAVTAGIVATGDNKVVELSNLRLAEGTLVLWFLLASFLVLIFTFRNVVMSHGQNLLVPVLFLVQGNSVTF